MKFSNSFLLSFLCKNVLKWKKCVTLYKKIPRNLLFLSRNICTYPLSTLKQLSKQAPFVQLQDVALTKTALKQTKEEANLTFVIFESRELKLIDCLCLYFSVLFSESPNSEVGCGLKLAPHPLIFYRSVNPIPTSRADYVHHITTAPPDFWTVRRLLIHQYSIVLHVIIHRKCQELMVPVDLNFWELYWLTFDTISMSFYWLSVALHK